MDHGRGSKLSVGPFKHPRTFFLGPKKIRPVELKPMVILIVVQIVIRIGQDCR